ncbi:MAG: adenosylmethionine--8-amino-7-oxononanoate transaminase [Candidatus Velthaea sp.]|jgi:adenosylmethionine-8-amino-7-oxononanoate aminotransferase
MLHIWQPYSQMKTAPEPALAVSTNGCRITLADGRELIDGTASWWTACHGYNHPWIRAAVEDQLARMPHVMFGGLVHEPALQLATRLTQLLPAGLQRVFFSESGSVSVEIALKIALNYWRNNGVAERTEFVFFKNAYHGDTFGAMAVSDAANGFANAFARAGVDGHCLALPASPQRESELGRHLERHGDRVAAIVVEPLVQGAGGMKMHDARTLVRIRELANRYECLLICDEIFTGFGRTGSMFACAAADVRPDIITLSKAITGGTLPLAATVVTSAVFSAFWSDEPAHALMHGPTYMANPLACAAANASLDLFEREPRLDQVAAIERNLRDALEACRKLACVADVRVTGAVGAVELHRSDRSLELRRRFLDAGVWIRPFGNTVYLTPAFTIDLDELRCLTGAIEHVLAALD